MFPERVNSTLNRFWSTFDFCASYLSYSFTSFLEFVGCQGVLDRRVMFDLLMQGWCLGLAEPWHSCLEDLLYFCYCDCSKRYPQNWVPTPLDLVVHGKGRSSMGQFLKVDVWDYWDRGEPELQSCVQLIGHHPCSQWPEEAQHAPKCWAPCHHRS